MEVMVAETTNTNWNADGEQLREARERINKELGKVLVGQHEVVEQLLFALFRVGLPDYGGTGTAKTLQCDRLRRCFI